ncbi:MAG TPA: hypothetical protein PLN96_16190 [Zoogloea sp.]|nr:hypothetical protein [Rhodocyclaceae bacterium]HMZ75909.1 hypothetical protein [Rhodocyclaceae bacterium]HNB63153.1 hypothetical protein [Rhodocyclaceae bacterium]HND25666.1 hypothetical protein [Rhodocyclaceae bacterium]HNI49411.1 hypothetical protein [Zoogloea sp.]
MLLVAWVAGLEDDDLPAPPSVRRVPPRPTARSVGSTALDVPPRRSVAPDMRNSSGDLFPVVSFEPPPPPPPPSLKPVAPPLPFRYAGGLDERGDMTAFLADGEQIRVVRAGELIDGRYRVVLISRVRIDFLYLPLNEPQSLATGNLP